MIENYQHFTDYYLITVVVDRHKTKSIVQAAIELGVKPTLVANARGLTHGKKLGFLRFSGISPSMDMVFLLVPKAHLDAIMTVLIEKGKLDHFGGGAIYASHVHDFWISGVPPFDASKGVAAPTKKHDFQQDLVAITSISQRGSAEEIARGAMLAGSPSPIISFGYGHGIRDRLNFLLQLAINPKKELLELVVGNAESDRIFEIMVERGKLDQPAMGFIFTRKVEKGLINTISWQNTTPYAATMEQIIKAIDQMQGNTNWRARGTVQTTTRKERKMLRGLVNLNIIVQRGFADVCSLAVMEAGAGGTSVMYTNAYPQQKQANSLAGSDEREIISASLAPNQVEKIVATIASLAELKDTPVMIYTYPILQALTYIK
ncbi:MAG: hypothetical protein JSR44_01360 [Spirochaetes bacterium]|nr:hypothetical protein [Spirochaetota bacterium]